MGNIAMATITIRNLDEQIKARLRVRAAIHGRSMEDEARDILRTALSVVPEEGRTLVNAIRGRIEPLGGVELPQPDRGPIRDPVDLGA